MLLQLSQLEAWLFEGNTGLVTGTIIAAYFLLFLLALRNPGSRAPLFRLSVIIVIVGFVVINFLASLPKFVVAENLTYAVLFTISLVFSDGRGGKLLSMLLSMFIAGRVSGSILSSAGNMEPITVSHILIEVHLLFVGVISWILLTMPKTTWEVLEKEFAEPPSE
ncbi:MAG: hypothetical protein F7B59_07665 [Desulfurococcales archaeon]|nr:hypothetical protein [Desulfurococcales archaeon]